MNSNDNGNHPVPEGKVVGVDLGAARVGLAVSDETRAFAFARTFIEFGGYKKLVTDLIAIARKEAASEFVIGLPLNMDGSHGPQAAKAEKLAQLLKIESGLKVYLFDERLSTVEASRLIHESGRRIRDKGVVDSAAARVILQAYLDGQKNK